MATMPAERAETLTIESADGARSGALVFAAASEAAPAILILPAMGTPARFYTPFAQALQALGVHAVAMDLRGIGTSSLRAARRVDFGYRELVELDCAAALAAMRQRFPRSPLWILGHSLGGHIGALFAAHQPQDLAGLILIASGSVHHRAYPGPKGWGFLAFTQFAVALSAALGYFPGRRVGFGGTEARTLIRDWARCARTGQFKPAGAGIDYEAKMREARLPLLGISFEADGFAPHSAAGQLMAKLPSARPTHWKLGPQDTAGLRIDHYSWVKNPQVVAGRMAQWLGAPQPHR
jgi:predicted alpha/beta hydrolase